MLNLFVYEANIKIIDPQVMTLKVQSSDDYLFHTILIIS